MSLEQLEKELELAGDNLKSANLRKEEAEKKYIQAVIKTKLKSYNKPPLYFIFVVIDGVYHSYSDMEKAAKMHGLSYGSLRMIKEKEYTYKNGTRIIKVNREEYICTQ